MLTFLCQDMQPATISKQYMAASAAGPAAVVGCHALLGRRRSLHRAQLESQCTVCHVDFAMICSLQPLTKHYMWGVAAAGPTAVVCCHALLGRRRSLHGA
jgi:hypothetical protein